MLYNAGFCLCMQREYNLKVIGEVIGRDTLNI